MTQVLSAPVQDLATTSMTGAEPAVVWLPEPMGLVKRIGLAAAIGAPMLATISAAAAGIGELLFR